jgi:protease secretion system outer membrane protein
MMRSILINVAALGAACTFYSGLAWAQNAPAGPVLRPHQAYEQALQANPGLRASRAILEANRERVPLARSGLLPQAQMSFGRNQNDLDTTAENIFGQPSKTNTEYYSYNKTLSIRQPVLNVSRWLGLDQSKAQVRDAEANYQRDTGDLAVKVSGAYLDVLVAQDQWGWVQAQQKQLRAALEGATQAFQAGSGTRTDIDEARTRLDMTQASLLEAEQTLEYNRRQLATLMNVAPNPLLMLAPLDPAAWAQAQSPLQPLEWWEERALQANPEILSLQARLEVSQREVQKARAGHAPTLDAVAQWSDTGNDNITRLNTRYVNKSYGLQLTVPLYQGGGVNAQVRQALADRLRAEEALENLKLDLSLRLHKDHRGVLQGRQKVQALEQALVSAHEMVRSNVMSRKAGVRTVLDVLNAEQQVLQVQRELSIARAQTLMAGFRLRVLAGDPPQEAIMQIEQALTATPH